MQRIAAAVRDLVPLATINWGSVGPLLVASAAIMGSPGPATISLTAAGSAYGVRRSLTYLIGVTMGTTIVLVAVATGITAAFVMLPPVRTVLIVVSAAYIIWLAYRIATASPLEAKTAAPHSPSLVGGTLLGIANPKAWVAIAAVFASAHLASTPKADAIAKVALLTMMIVLICTTWLIAGASLALVLRDPHYARMINIALALALVGATAYAFLH